MTIPSVLQKGLKLPVIAAPMFLVSGPGLVLAACKAGVIGTFPALNARPIEMLDNWMRDIKSDLATHDTVNPDDPAAAWGVNLIVHKSNARISEDLDMVKKHQPPLVITSVGRPGDIVDAVHSYGGVVFHDVINMRHAEVAVESGVDGLIAVTAGAGGHAGLMNPFTIIPQFKERFPDKTLLLAGTISDGRSIKAAEVLGADFAYMGTRFIATEESTAADGYKQMIETDGSKDITYTYKVSGIKGNFLTNSLIAAGLDPDSGAPIKDQPDFDQDSDKNKDLRDNKKPSAWNQIWSAGQGVGMINDSPSVAELVDRLKAEYDAA